MHFAPQRANNQLKEKTKCTLQTKYLKRKSSERLLRGLFREVFLARDSQKILF